MRDNYPIAIWCDYNLEMKNGAVHKITNGNYMFVGTKCGKMYRGSGKPTTKPVNCIKCLSLGGN